MALSKALVNTDNKILVTGASGFLGSAIVQLLSAHGYTNSLVGTSRKSGLQLERELGIRVINHDFSTDTDLDTSCLERIHTLIHCASSNDIASRCKDGGFNLSVSGTYRLIEAAAKHGLRRIIFFSTFQVYGTEPQGYIDENSKLILETNYALNHFFGEEICRLASHKYGIHVVILRPSNVYGLPSVSTVARNTLVPMCFVRDAALTGAIELRTSGEQLRNFVSLEEVGLLVFRLLDKFPSGFHTINAVSSLNLSILDVAYMVQVAWMSCYNKHINLRINSSYPNEAKSFEAFSTLFEHQLSPSAALDRFTLVIQQLVQSPSLIREPSQ